MFQKEMYFKKVGGKGLLFVIDARKGKGTQVIANSESEGLLVRSLGSSSC